MFIPYKTDAPVYYKPWGTVGLLVVNILMLILIDEEVIEPADWVLRHGDGLTPVAWITANFVHRGWIHLISNMIFLWVFGLIVEGKVGPLIFLGIYLGIGALQCFVEQLIYLNGGPADTSGASAVIFGLMSIAVIWAPKNQISVVFWVIRPRFFDMTVRALAGLYVGWNVFKVAVFGGLGFTPSSALMHLMGAAIGLPVGIVMLKMKWVDCENWDWFSVRKGKHIEDMYTIRSRAKPARAPDDDIREQRGIALEMLRENLQAGDGETALQVYDEHVRDTGTWPLPEDDLVGIIGTLVASKSWQRCSELMAEHSKRFPTGNQSVRLRYAALLIKRQKAANKALPILQSLESENLDTKLEAARRKLVDEAISLMDDDDLLLE